MNISEAWKVEQMVCVTCPYCGRPIPVEGITMETAISDPAVRNVMSGHIAHSTVCLAKRNAETRAAMTWARLVPVAE